MAINTHALLRKTTIFADAPDEIIERVSAALSKRKLQPDETLFEKGTDGSSMAIIASGQLKVHDGPHVLAEIGPEQIVGEFSLLDSEPRSASVTATQPSEVLLLEQADFYSIVPQSNQLLQSIIRYIIKRLRRQNETLLDSMRLREQELEAQVRARTGELSDKIEELLSVNTRLQEIDNRKNEIIRIVSHDIRSPVAGIASLAQLLQDETMIEDLQTVIRYGGLIANSAQSIDRFVQDILDLARLEADQTKLDTEVIDLRELLKEQLQSFEPLSLTKGVGLKLAAAEPVQAPINRSSLMQALSNLISNSIKFTPEDGTVSLALSRTEREGKPYASIRIADSGIGIPKEAMSQLFEKFSVLQRKGLRGEKGTGLGMSIAKHIIDLHQGDILVESQVNHGTTFTVVLPAA